MIAGNLHFARHYLRRAHQEAVRSNNPEVDLIATAHEEICELQARLDVVSLLCHFHEDSHCDTTHVPLVVIVGAIIGTSNPIVLDLKAALARGMQPERTSNGFSVFKGDRD